MENKILSILFSSLILLRYTSWKTLDVLDNNERKKKEKRGEKADEMEKVCLALGRLTIDDGGKKK